MASFLYEGVLLFGIVFVAGYLFSALTQQRHALQGQHALQAFLFIVLAVYFCWFWTHGGQTVAMKAWHIRVVDTQGQALSQGRALARYALSWLWFLPALLFAWVMGLHGTGAIFGSLIAGVLLYAAAARLHPKRQFLHDALCATQLITQLPQKR
ncbi:RDD family protein [Paucibacter hankyongi]